MGKITRLLVLPFGPTASTEASTTASILTLLGVPTHANLTAANTALPIGKIYYDTTLATLNVTTA